MTSPTLRIAHPGDAYALAEVHVTAWQHGYRGLLPDDFLDGLSIRNSADRWAQSLSEQRRQVWVACEDERVTGFVSFGASRDDDAVVSVTGEVYSLYVHPAVWRQGIGSTLMAQALHELGTLGYVEVTLWVLRHNQRARAFYETLGFATDGGSKIDVNAVGIEYDDVRYRLHLGTPRPKEAL